MTKSSEPLTTDEYLELKSLEQQLFQKIVAFRHKCSLMFRQDVKQYVEVKQKAEQLRVELDGPKTVGEYYQKMIADVH